MSKQRIASLRSFEGCRVSLALGDGSRIDDCQLVSAPRPGVRTLWIYTNGGDAFVPLTHVVDLWESR
jgi:hypothetical protein